MYDGRPKMPVEQGFHPPKKPDQKAIPENPQINSALRKDILDIQNRGLAPHAGQGKGCHSEWEGRRIYQGNVKGRYKEPHDPKENSAQELVQTPDEGNIPRNVQIKNPENP
jgi:hypothetical protein